MIIVNKVNKEGGYQCWAERGKILYNVVRDGFIVNVAFGKGLEKTKL